MISPTSYSHTPNRAPELPGPIIAADWLARYVASPGLRIIDIRDRHNYGEKKISGSAPPCLAFPKTL
jgi:hypothetical protein